jgi:SnoaL-like domain
MNEATVLAAFRRYWEYAATDQEIAHEMYHDDAVLEFPQSQERFEGKANFMAWRKIYPASVESRIRRIRGQGDFWVVEISIRYNGGAWNYGCSMLEFRGDKVARETIYFGEGWEAPGWRAAWRAAWKDEGTAGL